jgi:thiol-disulfide isomerase/thioredoxin
MIPKITLIFFLTLPLFAYQEGDALSQEMVAKLQLHKDKVYVIDFFASWCHSCEKEMPLISKVNDSLNHDKFEIIGVDVDEDPAKAEAFQDMMREDDSLSFRVINDPKSEIIKVFKPVGMPALYIIRNNTVDEIITGAVEGIDKMIIDALSEAR